MAIECTETVAPTTVSVRSAIGRLAARQHGVVSRGHLRALGLGDPAVRHLLASGWLHRMHRGVYAVGRPDVPAEGRLHAAVLAFGPGAVLSRTAAAAAFGLRPPPLAMDVIVPTRRRPRPGLHPHHAPLMADEVTVVDGTPVTVVPRIALDLAADGEPAHRIERLLREAEVRRLHCTVSLPALLARYPGRRGSAVVAGILGRADLRAVTRSELEDRFLAFLDGCGLPRPRTNAEVAGLEVDALWPEQRVVVELDGFAAHGTRSAFERDRERLRRLTAAGLRTVPVTWRHLHDDAAALERGLRRLLRYRP
jgi:hypothetical protein